MEGSVLTSKWTEDLLRGAGCEVPRPSESAHEGRSVPQRSRASPAHDFSKTLLLSGESHVETFPGAKPRERKAETSWTA